MRPFALLVFFLAQAAAVELNLDNWNELTREKSVFIKFYTSWCAHCKDIEADWDTLEKKYVGSDVVVVGHIQCDGEGHVLCEREMVNSFPTIKYGAHDVYSEYSGNNTVKDWVRVVAALQKPCNAITREHCSEAEISSLDMLYKMDEQQLAVYMNELERKLKRVDKNRAEKITRATVLYEEATEEYLSEFEVIENEYPMRMMNAIVQSRKELKEIFENVLRKKGFNVK